LHNEAANVGWHRRSPALDRFGCFGSVRGKQLPGAAAVKWRPSREHLVNDNTERVDIGAMIEQIANGLLRRHVRWRA
jgi:hypothetical protein